MQSIGVRCQLLLTASKEFDALESVDDTEVRKLAYSGFVADACLSGYRTGGMRRYSIRGAETFENAVNQRRWHQQRSREYLGEPFGFVRGVTEYLFFAVEHQSVAVFEFPVSDLVGGCVTLNRYRPLRGDDDPSRSFGQESPEQPIEWEETTRSLRCSRISGIDVVYMIIIIFCIFLVCGTRWACPG